MKISRSELRKIIQEASSEHFLGGQADYEEKQDLMRQMAAEDEIDYGEERIQDDLEDMYLQDLDSLVRIIRQAQAIDFSRLVGEIRKQRYLSKYDMQDIKAMLTDLVMKGDISFDTESGHWTIF